MSGTSDLYRAKSIHIRAIAEELCVTERYVSRIFRCAFLAPDIVEAIFEGRQLPHLTVEKLSPRGTTTLD